MLDSCKILCVLTTSLVLLDNLGIVGAAPSWSTALVSRVDDETFHYDSSVWTEGIPFNEAESSTQNALFSAYSSVFISKIRITMDGSGDGSCGNRCVFTFDVPDRFAGKHSLRDLVTLDGGVELKQSDSTSVDWVRCSSI